MKFGHISEIVRSLTEQFRKLEEDVSQAAGVHASESESIDRVSKQYLHAGSEKRNYRVYLPKGYQSARKYPVLVCLHGCEQNHLDLQHITGFDRLADRHNFIVVYPFVTRYADLRTKNCWGWWRPEQIRAGGGEVEDIAKITEEVCDDFSVDLTRIHLVGLSSGGGMAVAALTVHSGLYASGAVVAGVSYGERALAVAMPHAILRSFRPIDRTVQLMEKARKHDKTTVPLMVVHSKNDSTVDIQAGRNLRDSWLKYHDCGKTEVKKAEHHRTKGISWEHKIYGKPHQASVVETVFVNGLGHGWFGGQPGRYSYPGGPHTSMLMWDFFKLHCKGDTPFVDNNSGHEDPTAGVQTLD
ncbi:MAG: PHB depolymerase family esterase [Agarilytica sp.]